MIHDPRRPELRLVRAGEPRRDGRDVDLAGADLEPIVGGRINVGRVVFESLAGAIDLFPRKPGVTLEETRAAPEGGTSDSPFAALARIRRKT